MPDSECTCVLCFDLAAETERLRAEVDRIDHGSDQMARAVFREKERREAAEARVAELEHEIGRLRAGLEFLRDNVADAMANGRSANSLHNALGCVGRDADYLLRTAKPIS